jgi:hypothetical protein
VASDQRQPFIAPQQMYNDGASGSSTGSPHVQSVAEKQGKDWALPGAARGSIGITRPIRIECRGDRLTVLPEVDGFGRSRVVPLGPSTADSIEAFVSAVWEHMEGWGIAGRGLYWRPVLEVEPTADGATRLADLKVLLADSGLTVREKSLGQRPPSRYGR